MSDYVLTNILLKRKRKDISRCKTKRMKMNHRAYILAKVCMEFQLFNSKSVTSFRYC